MSTDNLVITTVYDNESLGENIKSGWGYSTLITGAEKNILFDTGKNSDDLLWNLEVLKINPAVHPCTRRAAHGIMPR